MSAPPRQVPVSVITMTLAGDSRYGMEIQSSPNGSTGWVSIAVLPPASGWNFIDYEPLDGASRFYQARQVEVINGVIARRSAWLTCTPTSGKPKQLASRVVDPILDNPPRYPALRSAPMTDGDYAVRATTNTGFAVHASAVESGGKAVNRLLAKVNPTDVDTADGLVDGATYRKTVGVGGSGLVQNTSMGKNVGLGYYDNGTKSANFMIDWNNGNNQQVTLGAAGLTLSMTNAVAGVRYHLIVRQDGTGSRTITTWDAQVIWPGGTAPTLTTTLNRYDWFSFIYNSLDSKLHGKTEGLNYNDGASGTAFTFTETDTSSSVPDGAYCSGATLNGDGTSKFQGSDGGTAGTVAHPRLIDPSAAGFYAVYWELTVGGSVTWKAGTWTVRLNITTANASLTWEGCFLCRLNSSNVNQATIGSVTGIGTSLGSTGVKQVTVTGASQSPAANDKVLVILTFNNSAAIDKSFSYKSDQAIDTPFTK